MMRAPFRLTIASALLLAAACSTPKDDVRIGIDAPDRAQFEPVAAYLDHRCGSLDCHGSSQRNLIIYGCEGLRFDPTLTPGCRRMGGVDTTDAENDRTYRSVVGLEPAVMSAVVRGKGEDVEMLSIVRKARGAESHKGGTLVVPGDAQDICLTSWLSGATDTAACATAVETP